MDKPIKKLNLNRETVKTLSVKAGVRTGADISIIAQGGASGRSSGGSVLTGSRGNTQTCGLSDLGGLGGLGGFGSGIDRNGGH